MNKATIYWPSYLFNADGTLATRPQITAVDTTLSYGESFYICTSATNISMVTLVKPGAVTHQFNQDQRFIPLSFTPAGFRLRVTAPANDKEAPPGDYLLFIVNQDSVPSIASWIRLKPAPSCSETMCGVSGSIITQTWDASNAPHVISGDLTIPVNETLTIAAGTQVAMIGSGTEIIVEGTLLVNGTAASKAKFVSNKCAPQEGDWWGINVRPGGTAKIQYADMQHAVYGVYATSAESLRVDHCTLANNQNYDIYVDGGGSTLKARLMLNTITVGGGSGIAVTNAPSRGRRREQHPYGQLLDHQRHRDRRQRGLRLAQSDLEYDQRRHRNRPSNCKWGIYVAGGNPTIGTGSRHDQRQHHDRQQHVGSVPHRIKHDREGSPESVDREWDGRHHQGEQ